MNKNGIAVAIEVFRPVAVGLASVVRGLHFVLIGWWYEKRLRVKQQSALVKEVRETFWFLFSQRNGEIVPNGNVGHLALLKCPIVTIRSDDLLFRCIQWRENRQVHVGNVRLSGAWHELSSVLNVIFPDKVARHSIVFFQDAARLLRDNFDLVREAFSESRYPLLRQQLDEAEKYDRNTTRQAEVVINQSLYR